MFSIRPLREFTAWLDELADLTVRGVVVARIKRLERGLMGDGMKIVVLLVGGSKRTQKADIKRAKALAAMLD